MKMTSRAQVGQYPGFSRRGGRNLADHAFFSLPGNVRNCHLMSSMNVKLTLPGRSGRLGADLPPSVSLGFQVSASYVHPVLPAKLQK